MRSHETLWVQSPTFTFPAPHCAPAWLVQVAVSALCCPCPLLPGTPPPLQQPLVTVKVVMRCCQPWSRTLDNKAKVINWWWLDSNSPGPPWHVTCDAWYHKYLLIFWHHVTWSNFHLTPLPATHALHEPEPTYWANSQISIPGAVSDILQPSSCVLWKPTQQSLCFQEMRLEAGTLFQNLVAEGHSQLLSKAETKILWNDEITNIIVFYMYLVHLHFIMIHKNEFIYVKSIYLLL